MRNKYKWGLCRHNQGRPYFHRIQWTLRNLLSFETIPSTRHIISVRNNAKLSKIFLRTTSTHTTKVISKTYVTSCQSTAIWTKAVTTNTPFHIFILLLSDKHWHGWPEYSLSAPTHQNRSGIEVLSAMHSITIFLNNLHINIIQTLCIKCDHNFEKIAIPAWKWWTSQNLQHLKKLK